jgi:EKC/KEOPS complex subunit PCC1/LAGE3
LLRCSPRGLDSQKPLQKVAARILTLARARAPRRTLTIPFPTPRLATTALNALVVDQELSPLVRRRLQIDPAEASGAALQVRYRATTNRMLRVAVNGFFESLSVVLEVMQELDVDVVGQQAEDVDLKGVQGLVAA